MSFFYYFLKLVVTSIIFFICSCTSDKLILKTDNMTSKFENVQIVNANYYFYNFLKPYHINVQQGNVISQEMIMQLRKGMTRNQVQFILGTSLLPGMLHANRWDYQFSFVKANKNFITTYISIFFKDDVLDYYTGKSIFPTEQEYLSLMIG